MTQHLVQLTDTHLRADLPGTLRGVATHASLAATLAAVQRRHWPADAVLLTGDLADDGSAAAYGHLRSLLADAGCPVLCLAGNHDEPQILREVLAAAPFRCAGTLHAGGWCIAGLDTHVPGAEHGELSAQALAGLDETLRRHARGHVLVCLHHHPVPTGSPWLDGLGLRNARELFEVLDRHDCVRGLLWGHVHQRFEGRRGGVRLMATPSTCVQFRPRTRVPETDDLPPAYRWLRLHGDGTIDTDIAWVPGAGR